MKVHATSKSLLCISNSSFACGTLPLTCTHQLMLRSGRFVRRLNHTNILRILHVKILKLWCISVATCVLPIYVTIHVWMHPDLQHVSLHVRSSLTHTLQPQSCSVRKVQHFTRTQLYVFPSTSSFTTMYIHTPMALYHCYSVVDLRTFTLPVAYLPKLCPFTVCMQCFPQVHVLTGFT